MLRFLRGATRQTKTVWWVLIFLTAGSFLFGFVFLLGSGIGTGPGAGNPTVAGKVNGERIQWGEYQNAVANQREAYRKQYGSEPVDREERMVEVQAWRNLVMEKLMAAEARALGIPIRDREVMLTLASSPPQPLATAPAFQTEGKFDPAKYQQALRDPNNNWRPFEDMVREQLPVRKLQERLVSSIKVSEPELLQAFHDRFDRASVTVVQVPAVADTAVPAPTEADLDRTYQENKGRFSSDARVQLEVLLAPKQAGEEELRAARELAQSLANRARGGEDFAALVRDYSEGMNADQGGVVDRYFQAEEFGPEMGPKLAALNPGDVSDPFPEATRIVVVKLIEKTPAAPPVRPALKIAQLVIKVRPNEEAQRQQNEQLKKLRDRARRIGLGRAAAERGLATARTEWFDFNASPQALMSVPEAGDWGLTAKLNEVSPVFVGVDELAIVQVADRREAGSPPREEMTDALRQIARLTARVAAAKPAADALAASVAGGRTLEAAAQAAGIPSARVEGLTRARPDPRLGGAPEFVGALMSAAPGKVVGPVRGRNGWYFGRIDQRTVADSALYNAQKGQITSEILQRRQQAFLIGYLASVRGRAKVEDRRVSLGS